MPDTDEVVLQPALIRSGGVVGLMVAAGWVVASVAFLLRLHGVALVVGCIADFVVLAAIVVSAMVLRPHYAVGIRSGELLYRSATRERIVLESGHQGRIVQIDAALSRATTSDEPVRFWLVVRDDNTVALKLECNRGSAMDSRSCGNAPGCDSTSSMDRCRFGRSELHILGLLPGGPHIPGEQLWCSGAFYCSSAC